MTNEAKRALQSTGTTRQGATTRSGMSAATRRELQDQGLLGKRGGLTRAGSIAKMRADDADDAKWDALFG